MPALAAIKSWDGVVSVLDNQKDFRVLWGPHTFYMIGYEYMLSGDKLVNI